MVCWLLTSHRLLPLMSITRLPSYIHTIRRHCAVHMACPLLRFSPSLLSETPSCASDALDTQHRLVLGRKRPQQPRVSLPNISPDPHYPPEWRQCHHDARGFLLGKPIFKGAGHQRGPPHCWHYPGSIFGRPIKGTATSALHIYTRCSLV